MFASTMIELMRQIDSQVQGYDKSTPDPREQFTVGSSRMTKLTGPLYIARM